jgi:hypothetical protein
MNLGMKIIKIYSRFELACQEIPLTDADVVNAIYVSGLLAPRDELTIRNYFFEMRVCDQNLKIQKKYNII